MKKFKRIIAGISAVAVTLSFSGCIDYESIIREVLIPDETTTTTDFSIPIIPTVTAIPSVAQTPVEFADGSSTLLSLNSDSGELSITRRTRDTSVPMGDPDTWTIFVYLCGTDLESNGNGCASHDMQEMLDGSVGSNVKYVVETGGTLDWDNRTVDAFMKQRYTIEDGVLTEVYSEDCTNMGDAATLSDFLSWGVENYPAEKMGVVFWNHGGGSISGVCFDELYEYDSLTLKELDTAFTSVFDEMTDKFEFIGFDACLMSTLETVNILAPHARYMYASEELEPGSGWDYTAIGEFLGSNPSADGEELGKHVCDSFYDSGLLTGEADSSTLAVIDLSKADALVQAVNTYATALYGMKDDNDALTAILRAISSVENYGGNNRSEGYTNMVDLAGIAKATSDYAFGDDVVEAVENAVVYQVRGEYRSEGYGISIYYPLSIQGSEELTVLKEICPSPYYMAFVDLIAYCGETSGDSDGYDDSYWFDESYWYDEDYSSDFWEDYDYEDFDINFDSSVTAIDFLEAPHLDDSGAYTFTLTEDSIYNVDSIYCSVMMSYLDGDKELMLDLGTDDYVDVDWFTGKVSDYFSGYWFALPDGQPLAAYLIEANYDYNIYTAPVYLNDELTNLRIRQDYYDDYYTTTMLGTWDGIDASGLCSRKIRPLEIGDRLCPEYDAYDAYTGEYYDLFYGEDWVYVGDDQLTEALLYEGDYYYSYEIYDVYGGVFYTDFVLFGVEADGGLYYYPDDEYYY